MSGIPRLAGGLWTVFAVKLVTNTSARFVYAFLPAIARGLGISLSAAGVLNSVRWLMGATTPVVVRAAGLERRRRVALTGLSLFVAGALVTAVTGVFVGALVGFALLGVAKPVFDTAAQAWISDRVVYTRRARVMAVVEATWSLSFLVGAPAAGWLISRWGWSAPFWVLGVAGALLAVPVAINFRSDGGVVPAGGSIVWNRSAYGFLAATVLLVGSVELLFITFAAWLETSFGFTVAALGLVAVAIGVAELVAEGATAVATDRLGKVRAVAGGAGVCVVAYLILVFAGSATPAVIGIVLAVAAFEFAFVSSISLATELQRDARIAFLSRFVVAQAVGRAVAAVSGVALFTAGGMEAVAVVAAVAVAASATVLRLTVREGGDVPPSSGDR